MEQLSKEENAFIRPSPSEGTLGGVHRKTRETILLCEAAGFDIILIETIGVGQSEVIVRTMVDMFLMLTITGGGDELQGMKKGMMELADAIIITKSDGDNKKKAIKTMHEYNQILRFLKPITPGWETKACTCSSLSGEGILEIWNTVKRFMETTKMSGVFFERRKMQLQDWLHSSIRAQLYDNFFQNEAIKEQLPAVYQEIFAGKIPISEAVEQVLKLYFNNIQI